jgi:hypothetical protein
MDSGETTDSCEPMDSCDVVDGCDPIDSSNPMDRSCIEKDLAALEHMRRARMNFGERICAASASQEADILAELRFESMFEFAEFYFIIKAMGLNESDDISFMAEAHNQRVADLLKNPTAMRQRKLSKDRLLNAIFTADTRPRLESVWRQAPGALDQSNLIRFLLPQMSSETTRKLVVACSVAGFLTRREEMAFGTVIVASTGVMEDVFGRCMHEMRLAIAEL